MKGKRNIGSLEEWKNGSAPGQLLLLALCQHFVIPVVGL